MAKKFEDMTPDEIFDLCANKTVSEIISIKDEDLQREAMRYWFNRLLTDHDDNNRFVIVPGIILHTEEDMGLSELDKMWCVGLSMDSTEGFINIWIYGSSEPIDMDVLDNQCLLELIKEINGRIDPYVLSRKYNVSNL